MWAIFMYVLLAKDVKKEATVNPWGFTHDNYLPALMES
jgi:hypothetical protein